MLGEDEGLLATTTLAVVAGITYNFFPFMALPLYVSLEQIDAAAARGGEGPLRDPDAGVPAGDAAALGARDRRRDAADLHPGAGDFINAELLGTPKQQMIGNVIQAKFLESLDYPTAASLSFILMAADPRRAARLRDGSSARRRLTG